MYCGKCGKEIIEDSVFCNSCGHKVGGNITIPNKEVIGIKTIPCKKCGKETREGEELCRNCWTAQYESFQANNNEEQNNADSNMYFDNNSTVGVQNGVEQGIRTIFGIILIAIFIFSFFDIDLTGSSSKIEDELLHYVLRYVNTTDYSSNHNITKYSIKEKVSNDIIIYNVDLSFSYHRLSGAPTTEYRSIYIMTKNGKAIEHYSDAYYKSGSTLQTYEQWKQEILKANRNYAK